MTNKFRDERPPGAEEKESCVYCIGDQNVAVVSYVVFTSGRVAASAQTPDHTDEGIQTQALNTQESGGQAASPNATKAAEQNHISCESQAGERQHCLATTSAGVALVKSTGPTACLLGKTWGYDDTGIWVSDGCSGEFVAGPAEQQPQKEKPPEHIPNLGFLLYNGEKGQIYFRLFSYARYLNQLSLDPTFVDAFGNVKSIQLRQDIQLQKFFAPFAGWFLTPKFRYYLYVWSSNPSQGDPAQVVGAGNLTYKFNRFATAGFGITSLPGVRSTEGQFPYWLGRRRPTDRRRVLQTVVHGRRVAQRRHHQEIQLHGDDWGQPERPRRQCDAAR